MTDNYLNPSKRSSFSEPSPTKLVTLSALVLFFCIICSSAFIYLLLENQAKLYTDNQTSMLKNQAQITLPTLILTKDTLGMNIYLRTLSQASFINGLSLVNAQQQLLARAGANNGDLQKTQIFSQQLAIAELSLFINKQPASAFFNKLLWVFITLASVCALFTLFAVGYFSKKIFRQFSQQYQPLLEYRFAMELEQARSLTPVDQDAPLTSNKSETAISLAIVNLQATQPTPLTATQEGHQSPETAPRIDEHLLEGVKHAENEELVSLLKPDVQQRMPHFKPFRHPPERTLAVSAVKTPESSIELIEEDLSSALKTIKNPLLHPHEKQLDLYSLEHQSELNLSAQQAAYILFIDCSSNRAPIEDEDADEHQVLLAKYRRLIKLVVNIYGGAIELLASGDIRVLFNTPDADDNHGIQALCAAKLFNQLYKYYNRRQITRMLPTLNIQISLVRGNRDKLAILKEESHFLTRTTLSNELISHTPLSEVKALKDTLLNQAVTQRQEEDKILIIKLNASYQELLEKQARHLVKT